MRKLDIEEKERYMWFYNNNKWYLIYNSGYKIATRYANALRNMNKGDRFIIHNMILYSLDSEYKTYSTYKECMKIDNIFEQSKKSRKKKNVGDVFAFKLEGEDKYSFKVYVGSTYVKEIYYVLNKQSINKELIFEGEITFEDLLFPFPVSDSKRNDPSYRTEQSIEISEELKNIIVIEKDLFELKKFNEITLLEGSENKPYNYCSLNIHNSILSMYYIWRYFISENYTNEEQRKLFLCGEYSREITKEEIEEYEINRNNKDIMTEEENKMLWEMLDKVEVEEETEEEEIEELKFEIEYEVNEDTFGFEINLDAMSFIDKLTNYIEEKYEDELTGGDIDWVVTNYLKERKIDMKEVKQSSSSSFLGYETKNEEIIKQIIKELEELFNEEENIKKLASSIMENLR